jgi:hypothetical protein
MREESLMTWFLRILTAVLALAMLAWAAIQLSSPQWPMVEGVVKRGGWASENRTTAFVRYGDYQVEYTYVVNGRMYESDRFSYRPGQSVVTTTESNGEAKERQPREGDKVQVYYCPQMPSISVLVPGAAPTLWIWGVLTLLVCVALFAWSRVISHPVY